MREAVFAETAGAPVPFPAANDALALSVAQAELIRVAGVEGIAAVSKKQNGALFLKKFLSSPKHLQMFLASGPIDAGVPAAEGLAVLCDIWNADSAAAGDFAPLATAVALNYAAMPFREGAKAIERDMFRPTSPVERYTFYKDASLAGRLDPMFAGLRTWELRFVVDSIYDNIALRWAIENINIPRRQYVDACWFVEYRGTNAFGDTVQGPLFYMPWRESENPMLNASKHGGVCGSLSTFGSAAARAHGIPSYTCGQPGHCAYAVRIGTGDWLGGFGGPAGAPHHYFWGQSYYYILLMEDAYAGVLKTKTRPGETAPPPAIDNAAADARILNSQRNVWIARQAFDAGKFDRAENACAAAIAAQPVNFDAWTLCIENARKNPATTPAVWQKIADAVLGALSNHTRPACDLLARFDDKLSDGKTAAEKLAWFTRVHETVAGTKGEIAWDWSVSDLLDREMRQFPKDAEERWALFKKAVALHAPTNEQLLGQLLDWGVKNLGETGADKCIAALADVVNENAGGIDEKAVRKILGTAILAAEKAKSVPAFQAATKAAGKYVETPPAIKLERPGDLKLVSAGGLLTTSSTTGWDAPLSHGNVINETGGLFHTGNEKNPWAIVELPGTKTLTGILLVNRAGNEDRASPLAVSVSTDGATWHKIWDTNKAETQWFIPLQGKGTKARWVKVELTRDKPEYFHLRNILVYGE